MQRTTHAPQNGQTTPVAKAPPNKPCHSFTVAAGDGITISAAIWSRESTINNQRVKLFSANVSKTIKKQDGSLEHTNFFRGSELQIAIFCLEQAERWILSVRTVEDPAY